MGGACKHFLKSSVVSLDCVHVFDSIIIFFYCHCRYRKANQTACERRPRYDKHSCTNRLLWYYPMLVTIHSIIITPLTTTGTLTVYVDRLKRVYQNPPTTWLPLTNCKHIKLAVTKEKGMRHGREPDAQIECRVKGEIEPLMDSKVPVDMDSIFDDGTFENARKPMVILVEGALGSGKTSLAYHYCQKWAEGNLSMFDVVALVYLRHPAVHSAGLDLTLHQLLLLACASDGNKKIEDIVRNVTEYVENDLKLLLLLDGWDEAPACLRNPPDPNCPPDNSYLGKLLHSVSSNTTILITSRPDSSLDLHNRANVNRVEILGFTKESIYDYFQETLSTQLSSDELKIGLTKMRDHFRKYPAIESSCYIPLNAAILILVYLEHNRTLPTTHYELLYQLLLCCIDREVKTRQPKQILSKISSLDDLPRDFKEQLDSICILAYEGIMQNKVVFTQDELPSILPTPAQEDLPTMGVLQRVQWFSISSKTMSYNFVHLSMQELLAAYCISKMKESKQVRVFQTLLGKPRFSAVLQFYAGFTKLTNQGVRNIITGTDFTRNMSSKLSLLSYMRCFFEAQIIDESFYQQIVPKLDGKIDLSGTTMSPLDCMAFGYFLAFILRNTSELCVNLTSCSIDDHSLCVLMGELSKHAEASREGVLHRVTELGISYNKIGDNGIAYIATALETNTTMRILNVSSCDISDVGAESLAKALTVNRSLHELNMDDNYIGDNGMIQIATALQINNTLKDLSIVNYNNKMRITDKGVLSLSSAIRNCSVECLKLDWSSAHPDNTLKDIGASVRRSKLRDLQLKIQPIPPSYAGTVEKAKVWLRCVEVGGKYLIQSQEDSPLQILHLTIQDIMPHKPDIKVEQVYQALEVTAETVNTARQEKGLPHIEFTICKMIIMINNIKYVT